MIFKQLFFRHFLVHLFFYQKKYLIKFVLISFANNVKLLYKYYFNVYVRFNILFYNTCHIFS